MIQPIFSGRWIGAMLRSPDNSFDDSGSGFFSQAYGTGSDGYSMTNLEILNNTVANGSLLGRGFNGPAPASWTGFWWRAISSARRHNVSSYQGDNIALWTNTTWTDPSDSPGQFVMDLSGTSGPVSIYPYSDLVDLAYNNTAGDIYVTFDSRGQTFAAYPVGYTVTFIAPFTSNWDCRPIQAGTTSPQTSP